MYDIYNRTEIFYVCDLPMAKNVFIGSEAKLIRHVHMTSLQNSNLHDVIAFGDQYNLTGKDMDYAGNIKPILYYDGIGRIINPRDYVFYTSKIDSFKSKSNDYGWVCNLPYRYRRDPVPYTGKRKGGLSGSQKCRGVKRTYILATDTEYGRYIRKGALPYDKNRINWYNDVYEETRRHESWKNQKQKKQWM